MIQTQEWLTEATDAAVFTEEDHERVDQADREDDAVAAAKEARALWGTDRRTCVRTEHAIDIGPTDVHAPISHAEAMAHWSSRTYLKCLCRRHSELESEAIAELEDDNEA